MVDFDSLVSNSDFLVEYFEVRSIFEWFRQTRELAESRMNRVSMKI
jgi:hypothetical protein